MERTDPTARDDSVTVTLPNAAGPREPRLTRSVLAIVVATLVCVAAVQAEERPSGPSTELLDELLEQPEGPSPEAPPDRGTERTDAPEAPEATASEATAPETTVTSDPSFAAEATASSLPEETAPAPRERPRRVIEEVIVTAQKTEQSLQDVPVSIQVLGGELLEDVGISNMEGIQGFVPNMHVHFEDAGPSLTLRGLGTSGPNLFASAVGVVADEVALTRPHFILGSLFDVERIEVLKGPQGTLFGKNTSVGALNIVTNGPTEELSGAIGTYVGTLGEREVSAAVGGPVTDTLGVRVAVFYNELGEFVYNTKLDREEEVGTREAVRGKLRWRPTDALQLDVAAATGSVRHDYWAVQNANFEPATYDYLQSFDPRVEDDPRNLRASMDTEGRSGFDIHLLSGRGSYHLGDLGAFSDLEVVTVLSRSIWEAPPNIYDIDGSPAALLDSFANQARFDQDTVELRLQGRTGSLFGWDDSLEFTVGGYLFRLGSLTEIGFAAGRDLPSYFETEDALEVVSGQDETTPAGPEVANQVAAAFGLDPADVLGVTVQEDDVTLFHDQSGASESIFGQATWNLTPKLSLTAGGRFDRERRDGFFRNTSRGGVVAGILQFEDFELNEKRSESGFTPKVSLQYHWADDVTTYFTWARGFKSGGFNALVLAPEETQFDPERSESFDLGVKAKLLDGTLAVNAAIFRMNVDDLQVQVFDGTRFIVLNAASAISQGVEGDFFWLTPWEPLSLFGSAGWIDAHYGDGSTGPTPVFSEERIGPLDGKRLPFAPDLTAALSPTLTFPVQLPFLSLPVAFRFAFDALYTGSQFLAVDNDPRTREGGYAQFNARVGLSGSDGLWSVGFNGKNLGDERPLKVKDDSVLFPGSYVAFQHHGRRFGFDVGLQW